MSVAFLPNGAAPSGRVPGATSMQCSLAAGDGTGCERVRFHSPANPAPPVACVPMCPALQLGSPVAVFAAKVKRVEGEVAPSTVNSAKEAAWPSMGCDTFFSFEYSCGPRGVGRGEHLASTIAGSAMAVVAPAGTTAADGGGGACREGRTASSKWLMGGCGVGGSSTGRPPASRRRCGWCRAPT